MTPVFISIAKNVRSVYPSVVYTPACTVEDNFKANCRALRVLLSDRAPSIYLLASRARAAPSTAARRTESSDFIGRAQVSLVLLLSYTVPHLPSSAGPRDELPPPERVPGGVEESPGRARATSGGPGGRETPPASTDSPIPRIAARRRTIYLKAALENCRSSIVDICSREVVALQALTS